MWDDLETLLLMALLSGTRNAVPPGWHYVAGAALAGAQGWSVGLWLYDPS